PQVTEMITAASEETDTTAVIPDVDSAPSQFELSDFGEKTAPKNDMMLTLQGITGTGLEGRGDKMRAMLGARKGASKDSEAAVARALKWLAAHQLPDGGWNFDHRLGPCNGRCADPGDLTDCRTGATA